MDAADSNHTGWVFGPDEGSNTSQGPSFGWSADNGSLLPPTSSPAPVQDDDTLQPPIITLDSTQPPTPTGRRSSLGPSFPFSPENVQSAHTQIDPNSLTDTHSNVHEGSGFAARTQDLHRGIINPTGPLYNALSDTTTFSYDISTIIPSPKPFPEENKAMSTQEPLSSPAQFTTPSLYHNKAGMCSIHTSEPRPSDAFLSHTNPFVPLRIQSKPPLADYLPPLNQGTDVLEPQDSANLAPFHNITIDEMTDAIEDAVLSDLEDNENSTKLDKRELYRLTVCQLDKYIKKKETTKDDVLRILPLRQYFQLLSSEMKKQDAARLIAQSLGRGEYYARVLRREGLFFQQKGQLPGKTQGKHAKVPSLLDQNGGVLRQQVNDYVCQTRIDDRRPKDLKRVLDRFLSSCPFINTRGRQVNTVSYKSARLWLAKAKHTI